MGLIMLAAPARIDNELAGAASGAVSDDATKVDRLDRSEVDDEVDILI
jgi:hypothetical protein